MAESRLRRPHGLSIACLAVVAAVGLTLAPAPAAAAPTSAVQEADGSIRTTEVNPGLAQRASAKESARARALSGILRDSNGKRIANAEFGAHLEPVKTEVATDRGMAAVPTVEIARVVTDAAGRFSLDVPALGDMQGYVREDGSATVLVSGKGRWGALFYHVQAIPDPSGRAEWTWSTLDTRVAIDEVGATDNARTRPEQATPEVDSTVDRGHASITKRPVRLSLVASRSGTSTSTQQARGKGRSYVNYQDYCPNGSGSPHYMIRQTVIAPQKVWSRVQRVYTKSRLTKWNFEIKSTSESSIDAGGNFGAGQTTFSAGYVRSESNAVVQVFNRSSNVQMDARVEFEEHQYRLYCSYGWANPAAQPANYYEWRPYKATGYSSYGTLSTAIFNCDSRWTGQIAGGSELHVARSNQIEFSIGAQIYGGNLRSAQVTNSERKLVLGTGTYAATVCGYQNYAAYASQVREL